MPISIVKELESAKAKVTELTELLEKELGQKLAGLPAEYGFADMKSFIKALKNAAGAGSRKRRAKKAGRSRITPEIKDQVKALVKAGKTGAEIAKELGISSASVQNIKKALGLVKARK
jgi:hypothetical protein